MRVLIAEKIKEGMVLENPSGRTSTIIKIEDDKIVYRRGKSNIALHVENILDVYEQYHGCI